RLISSTSNSDLLTVHSFPTRRSSDLHSKTWRRCAPFTSGRHDKTCAAPGKGKGSVPHNRTNARFDRKGKGVERGQSRTTAQMREDRKSTRLNSSHVSISYAVFCLKKK